METNCSVVNSLEPGTTIVYYLPESLKTYIGNITRRYKPYMGSRLDIKLYYLVNGDHSVESRSIVPEQILGYICNGCWIDIATCLPTNICNILENFNRRFGIPDHKDSIDSLRYSYMSIKDENGEYKRYKNYYEIPTFDLSAKKKLPSPSRQLNKLLKRIEVNGEYMTAVWYDRPATVIKLNENDMYDTEKAYMWLLFKSYCDNNKSECDRVLKLMEDITFEKK